MNFFFLAVSAWCLGRLEAGGSGRRTGAALGWFALARGAFVLHGNTQFVVFTALFEGAWLGLKLAARHPGAARADAGWAVGNALGALVALPLVAEMLPAAAESTRARALSAQSSGMMTMPSLALLGAQVGWFPSVGLMDFGAQIALVGALAAAGIGSAWSRLGPRPAPAPSPPPFAAAWPWLAVAILAALAATNWLPLFSLPGLDRFRWPFKFLAFFGWFGTVGATLALARLQRAGWLRPGVTAVLLAAAAVAQIAVAHLPSSMRAFVSRRLPPEDDRLDHAVPTGAGRLAAIGPSRLEVATPFNYNLATLTRHFAFSGYDQLISRAQRRRALGSGYTGFVELPLELPLFARLEQLGVRWVLTVRHLDAARHFAAPPGWALHFQNDWVQIHETAAPWPLAWIARDDAPARREPCAVEARGNRWIVRVPPGTAGRLWTNVFPTPSLRCRLDGAPDDAATEVLVPPDGEEPVPTVRLPAGAQLAEWTIALPRLRWTLPVAALALVGCAALAWRGRGKSPAGASLS